MRRTSRLQAKRHARLAFGFVLAAVAALPSLPTCQFSAVSPLTSSPTDLTRTACHPSPSLRTLASRFAAEGHCANVSSALTLWQAGTAYIPTRQSRSNVAEVAICGLDERGSFKRATPMVACCNVAGRSWHPMPVAWYPHCCRRPNLAALEPLELLLIPAAFTCTSAAAALARPFIERIIEQHVQAQGAYTRAVHGEHVIS